MRRIILVGKGGSGKDHARKILEDSGFRYCVSHTTRPPRDGEIQGKDYHFISKDAAAHHFSANSLFYEYVIFNLEKANEFLAAIKNEILKLPAGMGGLPIHIIYPRRPRQEQNWLTVAFAEKLTETLAKLEPGRSFSVCYELYNINETTRTIDDKFVPSFEIRSRMASASLFGPGDERRLFIYADDAYAAGSTAAEALSFVHYHGGKVLAVAAMGVREFYEVAPSPEIKEDFERRYPTNSQDRKKLDEILHLKGLTVDTLNHFELRFFSRRKPQFLEIRDTDYDLKKASPVPELTAAQKAFMDREKETRRTQQI